MLSPPDCCICKEHLKKDLCVEKQCGNVFHRKCLEEWLKVKNNCPLCKTICSTTDILDIHFEMVKETLQVDELKILEKDKEELYAMLKKYEDELQITHNKNEQNICEIFTLKNKNTVLEETLKGMEVKKVKLQNELISSKETNDEYLKENYILKSQIEEYEKELNKMKNINSYIQKLSKHDLNNIYLSSGIINALTDKEKNVVFFNCITKMNEEMKKYITEIENLKIELQKKTQQLLQIKSENRNRDLKQSTPNSQDEESEKENEQKNWDENKINKINETNEMNEINETNEMEEYNKEQNGIKVKKINSRRIKRNNDYRNNKNYCNNINDNSNDNNNYIPNDVPNNNNNKHKKPSDIIKNSISNNLQSDFNSVSSSNFDSNFSNFSNISISDNIFSHSLMGNALNSSHSLSLSLSHSLSQSHSHSPITKLPSDNKTTKGFDFINFIDKKMNPYSPMKDIRNERNSPGKKKRKSLKIDFLRNKSVDRLFDDIVEEGEGKVEGEREEEGDRNREREAKERETKEREGEKDGIVNLNIQPEYVFSNSSSSQRSFDITNNKTPSPSHPNIDALFERIEGTTPVRVEYTSPKSKEKKTLVRKKDITEKKQIPFRRKTEPSPPVSSFSPSPSSPPSHSSHSSPKRASSVSNSSIDTDNEDIGTSLVRPFRQLSLNRSLKKTNIQKKRKTYSSQCTKITDYFKKM